MPISRGRAFEARVSVALEAMAERHPNTFEFRAQPEISLFNLQKKRPDFELLYRLDQQTAELVECQSRNRSTIEILDKIRAVKALSPRNRFVFVFEEGSLIREEHRRAFDSDGVPCLDFDQFSSRLVQLETALHGFEASVETALQSCAQDTRKRLEALTGADWWAEAHVIVSRSALSRRRIEAALTKPVCAQTPSLVAPAWLHRRTRR